MSASRSARVVVVGPGVGVGAGVGHDTTETGPAWVRLDDQRSSICPGQAAPRPTLGR